MEYRYIGYFRKEVDRWRIMKLYRYLDPKNIELLEGSNNYKVLEDDVRFMSEQKNPHKYMTAVRNGASFNNDFILKTRNAVNCRNLIIENEALVRMIGIDNI